MSQGDVFYSRIWRDEAEPGDVFLAQRSYCHGYDVFGELLGKASWSEFLLLLMTGEKPGQPAAQLLDALAMLLANPGPREASVQAAMNAGVGGSTAASSLMAALAVGAGQFGGARELRLAMKTLLAADDGLDAWWAAAEARLGKPDCDIWQPLAHVPGFNPHDAHCGTPVLQSLAHLCALAPTGKLAWLADHREAMEARAGAPLALLGVAAAAFCDLGLSAAQGEMLFLILRLPGAAAHALEQQDYGWRRFPYYKTGLVLEDDPGQVQELPDIDDLLKELGYDR